MVHTDNTTERYGWPVNDWAHAAGISRASVYELLSSETLETVKFGGKRLILTHPRAWLESLKGAA
jgi:predicted DNA-binding transcriptional regulator AlpA